MDKNAENEPSSNGAMDTDEQDLAEGSVHKPLLDDAEFGSFDEDSRKERREKNLLALAKLDSGLAGALQDYQPSAVVVFDDDGNPDIQFGAKRLYNEPVRQYNAKQYEAYWSNAQRIALAPVQPDSLDSQAGAMLHNAIKRINDEDIDLQMLPQTRHSFYMAVFGIGLGLHIERLVEETQCHFPIFIEPNLEFLYHSLEFTDWWRIQESLAEREGQLYFQIRNSVEQLDRGLRDLIRFHGPAGFDSMVFYTHYDLPLFSNTIQMVVDKATITLAGFGFVDDEFYMLRHTYANLMSGESRLTQMTGKRVQPCPVFVIGAGPSLDKHIEIIRANQDRAVIFSAGSAIRPLLAAGITPDLHLEIERNIEVMPLIQQPAEEFDLSSVTLIASSTVDPRMQAYFKQTAYFFRAALSCAPLFAPNNECQPRGAGPTVVNAALGVAQDVGFREVYLFGVDLGTKMAGVHHASTSWHNTMDGFENEVTYGVPVAGNFGGTVYSHRDLIWAKDELENIIQSWGRGRFYYNCSDGQRIKGTTSLMPRSIKIPPIALEGGKEQVLDNLWQTFPVYSTEMLQERWTTDAIMARIDAYLDEMVEALNDNPNLSDFMFLDALQKIFIPPKESGNLAWGHVFRGTMLMAMVGVTFYLNRIRGKADVEKASTIAREELIDLVEAMRADAYRELADLDSEGRLMRYVNRMDLSARSEKEIPDSLPIPDDLQALFDEQPYAEDLKKLYAERKEIKAMKVATRVAEDLAGRNPNAPIDNASSNNAADRPAS